MTSPPDPFLRKADFKRLIGNPCDTVFYQMINDGRLPKPDGYLGKRMPFWKSSTAARAQAVILAQPRPVETRPTRRRRSAEQTEASA
ncbi:MAG: hypothetical protein GEU91_20080 [Rhizobiales bacterium]|nr:hypothetical protein [Hyphomicrobiales bacterium]